MNIAEEIARLNGKIEVLTERSQAKNITIEELQTIMSDITNYRSKIAQLESDEAREFNMTPPPSAPVNGQIVGAFTQNAGQTTERSENPYASMEYRRAFMDYVTRAIPIPAKFTTEQIAYRNSLPEEMRAGVPITTVQTGAAVPFTVIREIINTVRKRYGNLYAKVRKLGIPGGVAFPIGALEGKVTWINEATVSPRQRIGNLDQVVFNYHTGEIRVAQTFLSWVLTVEDFETKIAEVIAVAYAKAMDQAIVAGTGKGMPLGILNDPRVIATGNVVTMSAADINNWKEWRKKFFAKLPLGYRDGEFIFPLSTVDSYLETMSDANNYPVFRQATGLEVYDGDANDPSGRFFGRRISLVEPDIIADFDTASSGDVIGVFWQPEEYGVNENFGFNVRRYFDEETNEWVTKAIFVVDGKVLNPEGIWLIKKA